ncbi:3-deoxy-7-phosphoheptulonate synthase [Clostridium grantii]|uniref:3-deoxy-D-arabinoheptulosonate-7-phosphate synthase n=1 Tax=Clostridium grantii DSM 8605 TaxID=1121316 RepID=A0A1M5WL46_9CLOT|nr:3-deoxy-7-phosphoheptulonate synthase [Clostridium grantii]SHH88168.1 3-deoxy-D-arabinoheptulosonate-7-phosphate synthase [Clostridium grantii DSM 8605]
MVVILKNNVKQEEIQGLIAHLTGLGVEVHPIIGNTQSILGLVGDTSKLDPSMIQSHRIVEKVMYVQEPFKKANKVFHPENSVISVKDHLIGGKALSVMAGPCSVESYEQVLEIAKSIKASGAGVLRGGAFKPRTSPYSFQGMGSEGLEILKQVRKETGLPIVTELMSLEWLDKFVEDVDIIQIGARNMSNFDLLKEVGKSKTPILLKRGMSSTIEEFLMSAEYIMSEGNENVILCERGIRTFETYTRNTLDLSIVPAIKKLSHLPIIVDPSHAAGMWWMVEPLAKAAIAAGADGLMIEVHNDPANAKCDGQQSIKPAKFDALMTKLKKIAEVEEREI